MLWAGGMEELGKGALRGLTWATVGQGGGPLKATIRLTGQTGKGSAHSPETWEAPCSSPRPAAEMGETYRQGRRQAPAGPSPLAARRPAQLCTARTGRLQALLSATQALTQPPRPGSGHLLWKPLHCLRAELVTEPSAHLAHTLSSEVGSGAELGEGPSTQAVLS